VGDRGMITQAHADTLKEQGVEFISALKAPQVKALADAGELQLSLFDQRNLAEISSERYPDERLVVCRNPQLAKERARKREELLCATEKELAKVRSMVESERGRLKKADAGKIGQRAGRVVDKYRVAKHFELQIADRAFSYQRKHDQIAAQAALDGIYVLRTTCPEKRLGPPAVVRVYKQLKVAERAFRTLKSTLEIRPIRHHLDGRVRAHVFLCLLAYYVSFELQARLAPLLYTDENPAAPIDPVAPAQRSQAAKAKAGSHTTTDALPTHDLTDLLAELGTLCRNELRVGETEHTFHRLTEPTPLQARALELLDTKLAA